MASVSRTTTIYGAGANRVDLYMKVNESLVDEANNTSRLTVYLALKCYGYSGVIYQISDAYVSIGGTRVGRKTSGSKAISDGETWYIVNGVSYTVTHNDDGTGSVSCRGYFNSYSTSSATLTLTAISRAGTASISPTSASISTKNGTTVDTITVTPKNSSFFHRVSATLNGSTVLSARWAEDYSYTMTIADTALLTALGNKVSDTLTVTVKTYATKSTSGTLIGTTTADATVSVKTSSIKPTLTSVSTAANTTPISGNVVAGYSTAKINFTPTPGYGATTCTTVITLSKGSMATASSSATSATSLNTNVVPDDASDYTITATLTVTDGRGATASTTTTISVKGYERPKAYLAAYRVATSGSTTADEAGTYVYVNTTNSITAVGSNSVQSESITYAGDISGTINSTPAWIALATDEGATFTYVVTDKITSGTKSKSVPVAIYPLDLYQDAGSVGAAFGGIAEAGKVKSFLPLHFDLPVTGQASGTSAFTLPTESGCLTYTNSNAGPTITIPDGTPAGWWAVVILTRPSGGLKFQASGSDQLFIKGQSAAVTSYTVSGGYLTVLIFRTVAGSSPRLALFYDNDSGGGGGGGSTDWSDITNIPLVTSISSASTDSQFPSAKCVYDLVGDVETLLNSLR